MSEDEFLLSEVGDRKGSPFRVIFVPENKVDCFRDRSGLVRSTVNIVDGNRPGKLQEFETTTPGVVVVDQITSSPRVN
jgi:hypothetical protein